MGFKSFWSAAVTLAGIELMHMIRKGQLKAARTTASGEPVLFVGRLTFMLGTGLLRRAPGIATGPAEVGILRATCQVFVRIHGVPDISWQPTRIERSGLWHWRLARRDVYTTHDMMCAGRRPRLRFVRPKLT